MRTLLCGGRAPGLRPASPGASSWEPVAFPEATLRQATGLDLVSQPLRPFPVSLSLTGVLSWATVGQSPRNRAGKGFCGTVAVRSSRPSERHPRLSVSKRTPSHEAFPSPASPAWLHPNVPGPQAASTLLSQADSLPSAWRGDGTEFERDPPAF